MEDRQERIKKLAAAQRKRLTPEQVERRIAHMDKLMQPLSEKARLKWCRSELCACAGCANGSGGLGERGFTQEDHAAWLARYRASGS